MLEVGRTEKEGTMRENFLSGKSDVLIRMFSGAGRSRSNSTGTAHMSGTKDTIGQVGRVVKKEFLFG